jgi:tight adherence protein B
MNTPMVVAACAFVAVTAFVLLVSNLLGRNRTTISRRLDNHTVALDVVDPKRQERIDVLKHERYSNIDVLNSILSKLRPARTAVSELTRADVSIGVGAYLALRLLVGFLLCVAIYLVVGNLLVGLVGLVVGLMVPRLWLRLRTRKRLKALEAQLAEAIDLLVGSLRAGHGFLQGLESVSREIGNPMRKELAGVLEQVNVGVNPIDALQAMTERVPSYDLALMVAAITVQRQTGGNLAEVLENLAATVRERRRVRGEVHALTTGPRVSGYVLAAIPFLLFLYFLTVSSDYRDIMLGTTYGKMLLGVAAVWSSIGFFFSNKMAKVEY